MAVVLALKAWFPSFPYHRHSREGGNLGFLPLTLSPVGDSYCSSQLPPPMQGAVPCACPHPDHGGNDGSGTSLLPKIVFVVATNPR